jgi:Mor family transcriptional regulator
MGTENLIEDAIGRDAYVALTAEFGGTSLYIPHKVTSESGRALAAIIGQKATQKLIAWAGGSSIAVPKRDHIERAHRKDELLRLRRRGLTVQEISRRYWYPARLSERQIYRLLNEN